MAQKVSTSFFNNPGLVLVMTYVVLFAINAAVLYLGNMFFPRQIVLGLDGQVDPGAVVFHLGVAISQYLLP